MNYQDMNYSYGSVVSGKRHREDDYEINRKKKRFDIGCSWENDFDRSDRKPPKRPTKEPVKIPTPDGPPPRTPSTPVNPPRVPTDPLPQRPPHRRFPRAPQRETPNDIENDLFFIFGLPPMFTKLTREEPKELKMEDVCKNPMCNHKTYDEDPTQINIPDIREIKNISDLITLGMSFHCKKHLVYAGMNLRILCNLVAPLTEMFNMIGMESVKEHMVNQILFFLQGNNTISKCGKCTDCVFGLPCLNSHTEMLHTVITGPPGVGKTELGKILGKVYKEMGILSKGTFKLVTRADLIGEYLGSTAIKTQKVIDECKGGVLFIDEAYSLGNKELRDNFSKECIDTLNQNLSEKRDFLCIIAGYEDQLEKCFFKYNEGLRRRFTFKYDIKSYNSAELLNIFELKVKQGEWKMCYHKDIDEIIGDSSGNITKTSIEKDQMKTQIEKLFKKNIKKFPNFGGDMETLLLNCKICHSRRCVFGDNEGRKILSINDITKGLEMFITHRKHKNVDNDESPIESFGKSIYSFS